MGNFTINDVLFFDTETTGIPPREAKWETDYNEYPHVVQLAWLWRGNLRSFIIRPDDWEIPAEATEIHGISTERAKAEGVGFVEAVTLFLHECEEAGLICGHNIHFDTSVIKANILRELGPEFYRAEGVEEILYKGKRIDTMRPAMKWVDARTQAGRLKFPNLSELYSRCFPGESFPAHDAGEDVKAVARCLPVLVEHGIIELKLKEYPEEKAAEIAAQSAKDFGPSPQRPENGPNSGDKDGDNKLPIPEEKTDLTGNQPKITRNAAADLLAQDDF